MILSDEIVVIAAGGHARVVIDALLNIGAHIKGISDPNYFVGSQVFGVPIIGGDEVLENFSPSNCQLANGIGANPQTKARASVYSDFTSKGFRFVSVIHPSATIGREVVLADGCQIMAGAVVQCGAKIGSNVVINTCASIDHDVLISDNAFIAPGATLCGNVTVGLGSFVGAGATLLPGVRIGAQAIVAAGALVCKDIADGECHLGVPARLLGK